MVAKVELASDKDATSWEDITSLMYLERSRWGGTADRGRIDTGSGFDLRDDAGVRTLPYRRRIRLIETATTPDTTMWQGRIVGDEMSRGPILVEDAKLFDVSLVDINADFGGIAFAQTPRPAETDIERIRFLLDTYIGDYISPRTRPSTAIADTYFIESDPTDLVSHMYSGVQLIDFFTHIVESSGRQFFLTRDSELYYASDTNTSYSAGISITDDGPDYSTSFPPGQPGATDDATEFFTGVRFRYSNNRVVQVIRPLTEAANDQWRTSVVDEEVTTTARALSRADQFLREFDHVQTTYRCHVDLPATLVDQLSWGMTLSFRSAAVGVLTPTTLRVSRCSWELIGQGLWRAHLELGYPTKFGRRSNPGTPPVTGPLPFVPSTGAGLAQVKTVDEQVSTSLTLDSGDGWVTPTPGNTLVMWHSARSLRTPATPAGWTAHPNGTVDAGDDRAGMFYKVADGSESSITATIDSGARHIMTVAEFVGTTAVTTQNEATGSGTAVTTGSVTPTAGSPALIVGGAIVNVSDSVQSMTPGAGWTELADEMVDQGDEGGFHPLHWMAYQVVASPSGSYNPAGTSSQSADWGGQTLVFGAATNQEVPVSGQQVTEPPFVADGSTTTGSPTTYSYASGSLFITSNGINVTDAVNEVDPDAGTYSFDTAPLAGSEIVVKYLSTGQVI